jgi:hypothetical protein
MMVNERILFLIIASLYYYNNLKKMGVNIINHDLRYSLPLAGGFLILIPPPRWGRIEVGLI